MECGKAFMYKPHLNIHIRKNHDSNSNKLKDKAKNNKISSFKKPSVVDDIDKPFKCRYCPKSFNDQFRLTIHTRVHTGESKLYLPWIIVIILKWTLLLYRAA